MSSRRVLDAAWNGLQFWLVAIVAAAALPAQSELSRAEALAQAFPGCVVERTRAALSAAERRRVAQLAGSPCPWSLTFPYVARKAGAVVGTAYFDAHKVRSKREVLMVVVSPAARIRRVEVLAFAEPRDYLPRRSFYSQFENRELDQELRVARHIRNVTGATLTARATTRCARLVLALHRVLGERAPAPPAGGRGS